MNTDSMLFFHFSPLFFHFFIAIKGGFGSRQSTPNGYGSREVSSPSQNESDYKYGRFDASALHIAHALKQTEIQKAYNKAREKPIDFYLVSEIDFSSFSGERLFPLSSRRLKLWRGKKN